MQTLRPIYINTFLGMYPNSVLFHLSIKCAGFFFVLHGEGELKRTAAIPYLSHLITAPHVT